MSLKRVANVLHIKKSLRSCLVGRSMKHSFAFRLFVEKLSHQLNPKNFTMYSDGLICSGKNLDSKPFVNGLIGTFLFFDERNVFWLLRKIEIGWH